MICGAPPDAPGSCATTGRRSWARASAAPPTKVLVRPEDLEAAQAMLADSP